MLGTAWAGGSWSRVESKTAHRNGRDSSSILRSVISNSVAELGRRARRRWLFKAGSQTPWRRQHGSRARSMGLRTTRSCWAMRATAPAAVNAKRTPCSLLWPFVSTCWQYIELRAWRSRTRRSRGGRKDAVAKTGSASGWAWIEGGGRAKQERW